ncbi:hypothetical protein ILYODFUR_031425, partial [Ilyodon furcidens]
MCRESAVLSGFSTPQPPGQLAASEASRLLVQRTNTSAHLSVERQEEIIPEHPNNSNIRCSPQDKRCIQKTMARHPLKSTNLRSNSAREESKPVLAPCRAELQRALDRLASNSRTHDDLFTIPIPNCDKNGDFHPKQ